MKKKNINRTTLIRKDDASFIQIILYHLRYF
nr:MAG TPA: hypothetical protein [Caudoviricetes sp.]DAU23819.1 MAG TPA: hypothetical protein [Caudoviricetes sp.]